MFCDHLLQFIFVFAVVVIGGIVSVNLPAARSAGVWILALYGLLFFCVYWGYFALFEAIWKGQTPGKRMASIRVIKDNGQPISTFDAIARNLMRAVDLLPGIYGVGCISMFLDARQRRLGDMVAGTVVVHDRKAEEVKPTWEAKPVENTEVMMPQCAALGAPELELIETFLHRRLDLPYDVRSATAERIAIHIAAKMQIMRDASGPNEDFLESIASQMRRGALYR